jgi:hypothetical protein
MPTIAKVEREIRAVEGFDVRILYSLGKRDVRSDKENVPGYRKNHERMARNTHTIADWVRLRFAPDYSGFAVKVLKADGSVAGSKSLLSNVRAGYDD